MLADKREHQQLQQAESMYKAAYRQHVLTRIAVGHKVVNSETPDLVTPNVDNLDDEEDEFDDEYLAQYRENRLKGLFLFLLCSKFTSLINCSYICQNRVKIFSIC